PKKQARRRRFQVVALAAATILVLASCDHAARDFAQSRGTGHLIGGPYARLLAGSTDLGADTTGQVQLTAALRETTTPQALIGWAAGNGLSIRWQPGQNWAYIDGAPGDIASALDVMVHNYRSPGGQV